MSTTYSIIAAQSLSWPVFHHRCKSTSSSISSYHNAEVELIEGLCYGSGLAGAGRQSDKAATAISQAPLLQMGRREVERNSQRILK